MKVPADDPVARALRVIPGASSTMAKSPQRSFPPLTASFATDAQGAYFRDERGREWIDCEMALGAVVWGHRNRHIEQAIARQLAHGVNYSVPAWLEIETAERILDRLEPFDSLRFCKDGSDAVAAAVRLARSITGRRLVLSGTYHGWLDWSAFHHYGGGEQLGIPEDIGGLSIWLQHETASSAEAALSVIDADAIAALVVCPEHWQRDELAAAVERCRRNGIIVIFDEVKSGLRYGRRGVFGAYGIVPDLLCISKGLANGLPLAVLVGGYELMQTTQTIRFSTTHAGECLSLAAANAAEELLSGMKEWPSWRRPAEEVMRHLGDMTQQRGLELIGYPGSFSLRTRDMDERPRFREHFIRILAAAGVHSAGAISLSDAHDAALIQKIGAVCESAVTSWLG